MSHIVKSEGGVGKMVGKFLNVFHEMQWLRMNFLYIEQRAHLN